MIKVSKREMIQCGDLMLWILASGMHSQTAEYWWNQYFNGERVNLPDAWTNTARTGK